MRYLIAKFGIGHGICIGAAIFMALIYSAYTAWEYREQIVYWLTKQAIRWSAWYEVVANDNEEKCPDWASPTKWRESLKW